MKKQILMLPYLHGFVTEVVLHAQQILNDLAIKQFEEELLALVDEGHRRLVIDFQKVEYFSSTAIGKLIVLHKALLARQGRLVLCAIDERVFEAFKITSFDRIFKIYPSEQEALQYAAA